MHAIEYILAKGFRESMGKVWTTQRFAELMGSDESSAVLKATERAIQASSIRFEPLTVVRTQFSRHSLAS